MSPDVGRYLLPTFLAGPGNQYVGLKEAVLMARHLERTLVLPRFVAHFTVRAQSPRLYYDFDETFDRAALARVCPVIDVAELEARPERVHHIRKAGQKDQAQAQEYLSYYADSTDLSLTDLPAHFLQRRYIHGAEDFAELSALDDEVLTVCGVFNNVRLSTCIKNHCVRCAPSPAFAEEYAQISTGFARAPHIRDAAKAFIDETFGGRPFLGFHLRTYDRVRPTDDFEAIYCGWSEQEVFDAVTRYAAAQDIPVERIFLATPPATFKIDLPRIGRWRRFSGEGVEPYFASLIEQEICSRAEIYVRSVSNKRRPVEHDRSSWGALVDDQRLGQRDVRRDASIDVLLEA